MKRYLLFGLLVAVVCAPLFFVTLLLTAAYWPAMDKLTLHLPQSVRSTIAAVAVSNEASINTPAKIDRIFKLDPDNATVWDQRCAFATHFGGLTATHGVDAPSALPPNAVLFCTHANDVDPSHTNASYLAFAQENSGDFCAAEKTYTKANSYVSSGDAEDLRGMGRSAYQCGLYPAAVAEFEFALEIDAKISNKSTLQSDREWLTLAYTANHQPKLAAEACSLAHPDLKPCTCTLQNHKPACSTH